MMRSPDIGAALRQGRARIDHHAVREDGHGQALDVVGDGVIAAVEQRQSLRRAEERLGAARADAQGQRFVGARLLDDGEHVIDQRFFDRDARARRPEAAGRRRPARPDRRHSGRRTGVADDLAFAGGVGIADAQAHQEAVELRFGQRIGAVVLHRVLRGDHHERARQRMRPAVDGDLAFVHGFEQRGLRLGGGAIDLVGQQKIAEDGAGLELEGFGMDIVDGDAQNVAGEHVAGELEAVEAAGDGAREGMRERGFADAGDVLDEQVAARQQARRGRAGPLPVFREWPSREGPPIRPACGRFRARAQPAGRPWVAARTLQVHDTKVRRGAVLEGCGVAWSAQFR